MPEFDQQGKYVCRDKDSTSRTSRYIWCSRLQALASSHHVVKSHSFCREGTARTQTRLRSGRCTVDRSQMYHCKLCLISAASHQQALPIAPPSYRTLLHIPPSPTLSLPSLPSPYPSLTSSPPTRPRPTLHTTSALQISSPQTLRTHTCTHRAPFASTTLDIATVHPSAAC